MAISTADYNPNNAGTAWGEKPFTISNLDKDMCFQRLSFRPQRDRFTFTQGSEYKVEETKKFLWSPAWHLRHFLRRCDFTRPSFEAASYLTRNTQRTFQAG